MDLADTKRFFEQNDHFAKHAGIEIIAIETGYAKVRMPIEEFHLNGVKTVHGGAIFTLGDYAFGIASNSYGNVAVGINVSISYVKAAKSGALIAEAKEVSLNPRLGNYIVNITDEQDNLIAVFQGTAYRKKDEWQWK